MGDWEEKRKDKEISQGKAENSPPCTLFSNFFPSLISYFPLS